MLKNHSKFESRIQESIIDRRVAQKKASSNAHVGETVFPLDTMIIATIPLDTLDAQNSALKGFGALQPSVLDRELNFNQKLYFWACLYIGSPFGGWREEIR